MHSEEPDYGPGFHASHPEPYPGPYTRPHPDPYSSPYARPYAPDTGPGRHRAPAGDFGPPLDPGLSWDPAEELAFMLQDAMGEQVPKAAPHPEPPPAPAPAPPRRGTPLENLQEITASLPRLRAGTARGGPRSSGHRKVRERRRPRGRDAASYLIAAAITVITSAVSLFGGLVAYGPLRFIALTRLQTDAVSWWPLLVYGPWLAASLSVLRAALHHRRAVHSWCAVLAFSLIAMFLCVAAQTPTTAMDVTAAALPGLASLTCFQQLVRQITLTRPPRRPKRRHRVRAARPQPPGPALRTTGGTRIGRPGSDGSARSGGSGGGPDRRNPGAASLTYAISDTRPLRTPRRPGPFPQPRGSGSLRPTR
ncbi:DUF2637 domain-containing protein [Streptomyces sp. NPDC052077]|uniref:DUF2637 domain-containing protein n=1 Tax=Streptomyces sp. NPDC052077 TaxID=3154757 RepID=UPI00342AC737